MTYVEIGYDVKNIVLYKSMSHRFFNGLMEIYQRFQCYRSQFYQNLFGDKLVGRANASLAFPRRTNNG